MFSPGRKDHKDSRDQVPPSLCLLSVVSHHITWRINNNGDVSRQICIQAAEHPAQLLPHGVGGGYVHSLIDLCSVIAHIRKKFMHARKKTWVWHQAHSVLSHVGFFWYECKEVWIEGLRSYFLDWWNCLDMMVLSMYLASFALRVLIMLKGYFLCHDHDGTEDCVYFTQTGEKMKTHLLQMDCSFFFQGS